jgi:hypothetical protein
VVGVVYSKIELEKFHKPTGTQALADMIYQYWKILDLECGGLVWHASYNPNSITGCLGGAYTR